MCPKYLLPKENGPGFNSNPDIIKSMCITLDKINRKDITIKVSIPVFVFNLFAKETLILLQVNFLPVKIPILDLY